MNANPTPKPVSGVQLLTKPSFADLRFAKSFGCARLVGAVGVEPTTNGLKGRCSATELRPCFSRNILHESDLWEMKQFERTDWGGLVSVAVSVHCD